MMATPAHISRTALDMDRFQVGVDALRIERNGQQLAPQQLELAGVLDAGERFNGVQMPRRSTKTTTLFAWILARCIADPEIRCAYTAATTGKAARDRFRMDLLPHFQRMASQLPVGSQVFTAAGMERIQFDNGSSLQILAPVGDDFRGTAFDVIVIDEGQDADVNTSDDLTAAILPTMDTKPDAQLIVAGTAGLQRNGNMLWHQLERGRAGDGGILEYSAGDLTVDQYAEWEQVAPLLEKHHPGVGTLTRLDLLRPNFERMADKSRFAGEYLGVWGNEGSSVGVFDPAAWEGCSVDSVLLPSPPERFALAFACSPNQGSAAIVAAWREDDTGHLLLIDHRPGTTWLSGRVAELSQRYKMPVAFDDFGVNLVEVEKMKRKRPLPKLAPQNTKESSTAAAKLVEEVRDGSVRHYDQAPLTASILLARRRAIGAKAYAYGRGDIADDIAAAEAASIALRYYDTMPAKTSTRVLRPTA